MPRGHGSNAKGDGLTFLASPLNYKSSIGQSQLESKTKVPRSKTSTERRNKGQIVPTTDNLAGRRGQDAVTSQSLQVNQLGSREKARGLVGWVRGGEGLFQGSDNYSPIGDMYS
jgi:hypothetical protein